MNECTVFYSAQFAKWVALEVLDLEEKGREDGRGGEGRLKRRGGKVEEEGREGGRGEEGRWVEEERKERWKRRGGREEEECGGIFWSV